MIGSRRVDRCDGCFEGDWMQVCWVSRISAAMGVEVSGIERGLVRFAFVDYRKT